MTVFTMKRELHNPADMPDVTYIDRIEELLDQGDDCSGAG